MVSPKTWAFVHEERERLHADLSRLTAEQWATPSLCEGWDVHDVVAHLVESAKMGRLAFVASMLRARGDFDRATATGVERERCADPADTLEALRTAIPLTRTPPAHEATRLIEAIAHGEDIRRPLGLAATYPTWAVHAGINYQLRTSTAIGGGRQRAVGLQLVDVDTGRRWGEGDVVEGTGLDLLLRLTGRTIPAGRFSGPGAERFQTA